MSAAALAATVQFYLVACNFVEIRELVSAKQRFLTTGNIRMTFFRRFDNLLLYPSLFRSLIESALILYFNNPGCQTCATSRAELLCAPTINTRIQQGRLKILSVYPDGIPDSGILPTQDIPGWMEVYDANRNVLEKDLYDLKAIPTLYLLDKDKKVLLKDVPVRQIEGYLESDTSSTSDS